LLSLPAEEDDADCTAEPLGRPVGRKHAATAASGPSVVEDLERVVRSHRADQRGGGDGDKNDRRLQRRADRGADGAGRGPDTLRDECSIGEFSLRTLPTLQTGASFGPSQRRVAQERGQIV